MVNCSPKAADVGTEAVGMTNQKIMQSRPSVELDMFPPEPKLYNYYSEICGKYAQTSKQAPSAGELYKRIRDKMLFFNQIKYFYIAESYQLKEIGITTIRRNQLD